MVAGRVGLRLLERKMEGEVTEKDSERGEQIMKKEITYLDQTRHHERPGHE